MDMCLFDKTGTLTTDELVAVGVEPATISPSREETPGRQVGAASAAKETLVSMVDAPAAAVLVLGGCQSLVLVEGSEAGDPVEAAAMKAIKVGETCGVDSDWRRWQQCRDVFAVLYRTWIERRCFFCGWG